MGFPDSLISEVSNYIRNSTVTLLIPTMNFTCNATVAGFIVAGTALNHTPHSQLQIWRKNVSQNSVYYKIGHISVNLAGARVCATTARRIVNITYWCILFEVSRLSVQPGDILGLQLPSNNFEILFTNGKPINFIHEYAYQLNSITLSHNESVTESDSISQSQQLPQILFNFTSGKKIMYYNMHGI